MDKRIYQIALSLLNGLGPTTAKRLVAAVGSLEGVFIEKESNFRHFHDLRIDFSKGLEREKCIERAQQELAYIEEQNIQLYYYQDPNYPTNLKQCVDAPIVLFTLGKVYFNQKNISIVGTRKCTDYGKKMTGRLVEELSPYKVQIISGLAHGIDKLAHETALQNGLSTLGVLGHGLDTMYPAAHRGLAKTMLENGGLVTEFISGTVGIPTNFPKRNRIIAGLSEATVVIESSETGGSMITANLANDYNREVFAFPGYADKEFSSGCNNLIKRSKAHLLSETSDLTTILGWENQDIEIDHVINEDLLKDLNDIESQFVTLFMERGDIDFDSLAQATNLDSSNVSVHLFNLEMKGVIKTLPGKRYSLV